jgi:hypothetical protein
MSDDLSKVLIEEQIRLLKEQAEAESRGRVGPLGGNKYDSRDIEAMEERVARIRRALSEDD